MLKTFLAIVIILCYNRNINTYINQNTSDINFRQVMIMEHYREKVTRGTPGFPFARYRMTSKAAAPFRNIHWHPEMEILYMLHGQAEVRIGKYNFLFREGDIAVIHPSEFHAIRPLAANCTHTAFVFSLDLLTLPDGHFFQSELIRPLRAGLLRFPQRITPADPMYPEISAELNRICQCENTEGARKFTVFRSIISLFTALSAHPEVCSEEADPHNETVKRCVAYMEGNLHRRITLSEIADVAHLHPNYLCKLFRTYTGQTVFEYLNRIRVEKAAVMLRSGENTVSQAASECGFESLSFFTRKFKAIMGDTPKHYSSRAYEDNLENKVSK